MGAAVLLLLVPRRLLKPGLAGSCGFCQAPFAQPCPLALLAAADGSSSGQRCLALVALCRHGVHCLIVVHGGRPDRCSSFVWRSVSCEHDPGWAWGGVVGVPDAEGHSGAWLPRRRGRIPLHRTGALAICCKADGHSCSPTARLATAASLSAGSMGCAGPQDFCPQALRTFVCVLKSVQRHPGPRRGRAAALKGTHAKPVWR